MVVFPVALDEIRPEIPAHLAEDRSEIGNRRLRKHPPAVFGDEDQMRMKCENTVPTGSIFHLDTPKTNSYFRTMSKINRAFKYKLDVSDEVAATFGRWAGVCRAVYNAALYQREHFNRLKRARTGSGITYVSQAKELTDLRAEFDWIRDVPIDAEQQALRDLDKAFANFFRDPARFHYPTPRRKFVNESFRFPSSRVGAVEVLNRKWARVRLPKVGPVKFRLSRPILGEVKNITITREANGWHIVFTCEIEAAPRKFTNPFAAVGIDRGVAIDAALSTGEMLVFDKVRADVLDRRHRAAQRRMARRKPKPGKKASAGYRKAREQAARIKAKIARARLHWQHEQTTMIADRFGTVVLEALKTGNMTRSAKGTVEEPGRNVAAKAGLNRSILAAAWFQFETLLAYKLAERGGHLVKINPAYTSQTCPECGSVNRANRENQAKFACVDCGHEDNADVNAARNILRAGTRRDGSAIELSRVA